MFQNSTLQNSKIHNSKLHNLGLQNAELLVSTLQASVPLDAFSAIESPPSSSSVSDRLSSSTGLLNNRSSKIFISAGEVSGNMHGAALVREARKRFGDKLEFFGLGGDDMAAAGVDVRFHLRDTAVMGLTEVLGSLRKILSIRRRLCAMIEEEKPQAAVLIDSPDLNQTLAKTAHKAGVPVVYYICPQVWAWRKSRLNWLGRLVKRRAVLFSFEKTFFEEAGLTADWVGHPLLDELPLSLTRQEAREQLSLPAEVPILAVLPGSRKAAANRLAGPMLAAADLLME
ncbi:MAG: hypothetical protein LBJ64_13240, partial [Deltaproteobacteria bacterium]|nr:hypothetical protein [Deltaproteobacteria bacterium]